MSRAKKKPVGTLYVRRQGYVFCVYDTGQPGATLAIGLSPEEAVIKARELAPDQGEFDVDHRRDDEF